MKYQVSEDWGGMEVKHGVYRFRWLAELEAYWCSRTYGNQWYVTEVGNDTVRPSRRKTTAPPVVHRSFRKDE